jgi:hypothetical protein
MLGLALLVVSPVHAIDETGDGEGLGVATSEGFGFGEFATQYELVPPPFGTHV